MNFPTESLQIKRENSNYKDSSEWKKEKALYEQKIELLEILVKESKVREENLQKMNENLALALNDFAHDTKKFSNSGLKEIQMILEKNSQDYISSKFKNNEAIKILENENKSLNETIEKLQLSKQADLGNFERERSFFETKIREFELEKVKYEGMIKSLQEAQKNMESSSYDSQMRRNNNSSEIIEQIRRQHILEIENLRLEHNQNFNELKEIYENEKSLIEEKLKSNQKLLKKYQKFDLTLRESSEFMDKNLLEKENFELKKTIEKINDEHIDEIAKYLQKIEFLEKKIAFLQNNSRENLEHEKVQLKDAILQREKESNSSRKEYQEKAQSIPFLHETSILNHKSEAMTSNELETINLSKTENNCFDMFFKELSSRNDEKKKPQPSPIQTSQANQRPALRKLNSTPNNRLERQYDGNPLQENQIQANPNTIKEDLRKEGMSFLNVISKEPPKGVRASNRNLFLAQKFLEELDFSINENNPSMDMVVINHREQEHSQSRTPLHQRGDNLHHQNEKSPNNLMKSKTIATALLCEKCEETFQPQEFLEHLKFCQRSSPNHSQLNSYRKSNNMNQGTSNYFSRIFENNEANNNLNEKYFSVPNIPENNQSEFEFRPINKSVIRSHNGPLVPRVEVNASSLLNEDKNSYYRSKTNNNNPKTNNDKEIIGFLQGLNHEKSEIIHQLKNVEEKLQKTQMDNQIICEEKENLQANLQTLLHELEKTKMQMAYSAEEKKQAETLLKKEIKVLIKKLIKTKGKLINQKTLNVSKLDCTNTSLINLSGFINFYNQNKDNSTFGTKTDTQPINNTDASYLNQSIQQVFSNSLFSLANKGCVNQNTRSKSKNVTPSNNVDRNFVQNNSEFKESYCTPNKYPEEVFLKNDNRRFVENQRCDMEKRKETHLFRSKTNESTTTKPQRKMNRYNN